MRLLWLRARVFVHATEDEDRVRDTLLRLLGLLETPNGRDRVTRSRAKGHYGNEILVFETTLRRAEETAAAWGRLVADAALREAVRDSLLRRVDEDGALHVRLDKQAAVQGRLRLSEGSDAIVVTAKSDARDASPATAWSRLLTAAPAEPPPPGDG